ncbi:MAG: hypothetical protein P1V51_10025 [Deltaproteobacteria bacterium]|nr:hypothetical protein [Deltaproteobacteria bacterium]
MKKVPTIIGLVVGVLVGAYLVAFALFNRDVVLVDLTPFPTVEVPIYGVAALGVLGGAIVMGVVTLLTAFRGARLRKGMRQRIQSLTEEVNRLRNLPLQGEAGQEPGKDA